MPAESDSDAERQPPADRTEQAAGTSASAQGHETLDRHPAGGDESVRLAPHGLRLVAFVFDVLLFAVAIGVGLAMDALTGWPFWILSAAAAVWFVYYVSATVWLMDGQTAGKAVCGLRVRRIDGSLPSRARGDLAWSFGRHSVGYLIADVLLLATISSLFTPRRRCPHDYAFGSEVMLVVGGEPTPASTRYRQFWELFQERHAEVKKRYAPIVWPLKWVTAGVGTVAVWLGFVSDALAAGPSTPASAAPAAKPLSVKGAVALWTTTTVVTGAVIVGGSGIRPDDGLPRNVNVVTAVQDVGLPETSEIYVMKADGDELRQLTDNSWRDRDPDLFADRGIVFTSNRDGNEEIYVMSVDGTAQTRLTEDPASDWCPDWSSDGTRIAFTSNRDGNSEIYVMGNNGSAPTRLTDDDADDWCPDWSPDGTQIAFTSNRDGNMNVFVMSVDGTGVVQLSDNGGLEPQWSPDMTTIAFTSDRDGDQNIFVIGVDRRDEMRLTDDPGSDRMPFWAPDGSKILFWSGRDLEGGREEVYVMDPDGSDQTKLTGFNE